MKRILGQLWRDDAGALIAMEWVFLATILVIGLIVGLTAVQAALLNEFEEMAGAIGGLSQSYTFGGSTGCCAATNGSFFNDQPATYPVTTCVDATTNTPVPCPD